MPKLFPALNAPAPSLLFRAAATREVTASLMLLSTIVPCGPLAWLDEARLTSKTGIDRLLTIAVTCFAFVLMTKLVKALLPVPGVCRTAK